MTDIDPLDRLRAADPLSPEAASAGTIPRPSRSADALFEEITTSRPGEATPSTTAADSTDGAARPPDATEVAPITPAPRRRWRPRLVFPAAAAVAGLVIGGAVLVNPASAPSTLALVNDAAMASTEFGSGRLVVDFAVSESPDDSGAFAIELDYRFDDGDYSLALDGLGDGAFDDTEIRGVGDDLYFSTDAGESFAAGTRTNEMAAAGMSPEELFGFQTTTSDPASIVELVGGADDFEEISSSDESATYRATVTVDSLAAADANTLPAGLAFILSGEEARDALPDTLDVEVVVDDGLLDTVTVDIDGETADGEGVLVATITTKFTEYGQPQNILAPTADRISDDALVTLPEGSEDAAALLDDLEIRRPGLCSDVFDDVSIDPEVGAEAFTSCLEAAGEQAAADAFRSIVDG